MFDRTVDGMDLRFHLAGINNQNFLMRDEQTGTYWQQITGLAVSGPLTGRRLTLVPADELSFRLWKSEQPDGTLLNDSAAFVKDYAPKDWDVEMDTVSTVISYAQPGLKARDLMLGIETVDASRAFPYPSLLHDKLIQDRVGPLAVMLVLGPDNHSVRAFVEHIKGVNGTPQFYRISRQPASNALLLDSETASQWNFQGCAISGKLLGNCLTPVNVIKDYWFDWRNYHPATTIYGMPKVKVSDLPRR